MSFYCPQSTYEILDETLTAVLQPSST